MANWCFHKSPWIALLLSAIGAFFLVGDSVARDEEEIPLTGEILQSWFDSTGKASFAEAQAQVFHPVPTRSMSFGYTHGALWLRLKLPAHQDPEPRRRWLELDSALLTDWKVFAAGRETPLHEGGLSHPRSDQDQHRSPVYGIDHAPGADGMWYVRVQSFYAINLNPHLHTTASLRLKEKRESFFLGSYAGVMLFTFVLTLYIFVRTRHINFLYYSFVILSFHLIYQFTNNHMASLYAWPHAPWWSMRAASIFGEITNFVGVLFIRDTLQTQRYAPKIDLLIRWIPLRCVVFIPWTVFAFSPEGVKYAMLLSVICLFFYYGVGLHVWSKGYVPARYFSIAWLPVLIGNVLAFLQDLNIWVASNPEWQQTIRFEFPIIGAAMQAILLGVAVGDQFRRAQKEQEAEHTAREKLEQGLDDAHTVQDAFIRTDSITPRFEIRSSHQMSAKIGGDWLGYHYDIRRKRLVLAISDVTGHGLPSALLTGALHGAFYGLVAAEPLQSLSDGALLQVLMDRLDDVVRTTSHNTGLMATMAMLCIDLENFRIEYRNAGHTPILISGRAGQHFMLKGGSPLGISDDPHFGHDIWQGQAGDVLFLFTDGLFEQTESRQHNHLKAIAQEILPELDIDLIHKHIEERMNRSEVTLEDDSSYILCRLLAA